MLCVCFVLQLFRPLLNISVEFSAEEFETALLTPNDTLSDVHMPLLKVGAFPSWFFEFVVCSFGLSSLIVGMKSPTLCGLCTYYFCIYSLEVYITTFSCCAFVEFD